MSYAITAQERPPSQRAVGRAVDVCFAAVPDAVSAARATVVNRLTGRVDGRTVTDGIVGVEVGGPGSTGTIAVHDPAAGHGGFGLRLLETLTHAWGVSCDGHTRVRVELVCGSATGARDA